MAHPGGRPTVATPELVEKAWTYVDGKWMSHKLQSGHNRMFPTVEGLALYLSISRDTIYERKEFSDIIKAIKQAQHEEVANGAAEGRLNPMISKLILSAKHDYTERNDVTSGGDKLELPQVYLPSRKEKSDD